MRTLALATRPQGVVPVLPCLQGQATISEGLFSVSRRIVMFSGGIGSYAAAVRTTERHGKPILLFTDVGGQIGGQPHLGEHADTYRFVRDAAADLRAPLNWLCEGRDIYDVFRDRRWLGNASLSHCSWELKTKPARAWLDLYYPDPEKVVVVVGIDWTEEHRLAKIREAWKPYTVEAPMTEKPYLAKPQMLKLARERGVQPPALYGLGFAHANCVGCVKAGQAHWNRVREVFPETFAFHEAREQEMRDFLGADTSILKDRTGGITKPLTLRAFRERQESAPDQLDMFDEGGCGCFLEAAS